MFEDGTGEMTVNRGKKHKYIGMTLDYSKEGACQITMFENLKTILETFDKIYTKAKGTIKSAAPANLFTVQEDYKKLDKERSGQFHSIFAQELFTTKRDRPDTGASVLFLTTRVRAPDQENWLELAHLMMYIRGTIDLPLTLSANGRGMLKWYVDGSYKVHPNMRKHSGGELSMKI